MGRLKILCINSTLDAAFRELGHEVCSIRPTPGIYDVMELLPENFDPDLFFQQEILSARVIFKNLHKVKCLKAFWSQDTHLNIHWQKFYGRCFDLFFTPHISFFRNMPEAWHHPRMKRLAMHGYELDWVSHKDRPHSLAFAGVVDDSRPIRKNILGLLGGTFPLAMRKGLAFADLLDFYCHSRILPNESIGYELNYRVTEGASAGCCVLSQNIGDDLEALYKPDSEVAVFDNGLELMEKAAFLLRRSDLAERMGQNARMRTIERHLPRHRAADVLAACADIAPETLTGKRHKALFCATMAQMARNGRMDLNRALFSENFASCLDDGDDLWGIYFFYISTFFSQADFVDKYRRIVYSEGRNIGFEGHFALAAHALKAGDALLFVEAFKFLRPGASIPTSMREAALLLADLAEESGRNFQPGFNVCPGWTTPETALEILALAYAQNDNDTFLQDKMHCLASRSRAYDWFRLGLTAKKHLAYGDDWRIMFRYGVEALICCKVDEGLAEMERAREIALLKGEIDDFIALTGNFSAVPVYF